MNATTKLAAASVVLALGYGAYKVPRMLDDIRTEHIIRQSAICANNIPGEGLDRQGEYRIGWLNPLTTGTYNIVVPGATAVLIWDKPPPVELKQGELAKILIKLPPEVQFAPRWTLPNGLDWEIPTWAMYGNSAPKERARFINPLP